ncbi:MAG: hypothetical protein JWL86_3199 [Rhizobium sp.]|nr:hypothetical protein [Rhizobium sp.]
MNRMIRLVSILIAIVVLPSLALAQESDEDEYQPELPDMSMYKAMLDANRQPGWVQFREFAGKQLIYFTALQTMRCRLSEIRYSVNSDVLDQRFPLGDCDPQQPFNVPSDDPDGKYIYLTLGPSEARTLTIQVVWADGSGSEIVTYRPCDGIGEGTCARIKKIAKPEHKLNAPTPEGQSR